MKPKTLLLQSADSQWIALHIRQYSDGHYLVSYRKTADNPYPLYDATKQSCVSKVRHYIGIYVHKIHNGTPAAELMLASSLSEIECRLGVVLPQNLTTI